MTRRERLRIAVKTSLLAGVAAFAMAFVYGMFKPGSDTGGNIVELAGIPPGTARLTSWAGRPVWVVHRSERQLAGLGILSGYVTTPDPDTGMPIEEPHRSVKSRYGVYLAETPRSGILVQFTLDRPRLLAPDTPWQGGFVDPASGAVFDTAGRRYPGQGGPPLTVPPHRHTRANTIRLGRW